MIGDHGRIDQVPGTNRILTTGSVIRVTSVDLNDGGTDTITGGTNDDMLIGGALGDIIDGNTESDLIFGDAVDLVFRPGDISDPRFRTLLTGMLYSRTDRPNPLPTINPGPSGILASLLYNRPDWEASPNADNSGQLLIDSVWRNYRDTNTVVPWWTFFRITNLWHTFTIEAGRDKLAGPASFGDDYIAGGADDDVVFGQLGNDTIQGDGSIASKLLGSPAGAYRLSATDGGLGDLVLVPSFEAATDGDDYIEGGGGERRDLRQPRPGRHRRRQLEPLQPGHARDCGPTATDIIFGGAGTRVDRNDYSTDLAVAPRARRGRDRRRQRQHHRIVGAAGRTTLAFATTTSTARRHGYGPLRIVVRGVELLDYTPGGPRFRPDLFGAGRSSTAARDIGGVDEVHGESGDDTVYGGCGDDSLFGDSEDDDLIGGWGNDWISGGTGQDGILGDDGRIFTSRNSDAYGEPLYGVAADRRPSELDQDDLRRSSAPSSADINVDGRAEEDRRPDAVQPATRTRLGPDDPLFDPAARGRHHLRRPRLRLPARRLGRRRDLRRRGARRSPTASATTSTGALLGIVRIDCDAPVQPG